MRLNKTVLAVIMIVTMLSACSSTDEKEQGLLEGAQNVEKDPSTRGFSEDSAISGEQFGENGLGGSTGLVLEFDDPANPLSKRTIFFMYDSSQVQQDFIPVIAAHAQYLLEHPAQRVVLEGHADERGSSEYNIALGEQRAKSVYRMMKSQGVSDSQLEIISYGEEKPVANGMDEASWLLNRRVEIAYFQGQ